MVQWSDEILGLIAPGISQFLQAQIPDVSGEFPEAEHWLVNHFLNSAIDGRFKHGTRQVVVAFLRHAQGAHAAYRDARERTQLFLAKSSPGSPSVARYYHAVDAWETFTLHCQMAMDLYLWLSGGQKVFEGRDGSAEQRLYDIGNKIKHVRNYVSNNQSVPEHTIPLWLSNVGLESFRLSVSYEETAQILRDICKLADELQNPRAFAVAQK